MKKILLPLILSLLFFSCSESPSSVVADFIISDADEVALGANYFQEINTSGEYPLAPVTDPMHIYVNEIGQKILTANIGQAGFRDPDTQTGFKYTFSVINDDVVNAFATPGGYIYIYKGLINSAKNEAELATVMSHEIGHVVQKHFKRQYVKNYSTQQISEMILGEGILSNAVSFFASNKYSRSDEFEADSCGVLFSARTNYNPWAFIGFFNTLNELSEGGESSILDWFSTHPATNDRIDAVTSLITRKFSQFKIEDKTTMYEENFKDKTGL